MAISTQQRRGLLVSGIVLGIGAVYGALHLLSQTTPGAESALPAILVYLIFFAVILGSGYAIFKGIFAAERRHDNRKQEIGLADIPRDKDETMRKR